MEEHEVTFPTPDGRTAGGFVAGERGAPGLVLVHEWYGLTDPIRDHARRFAALGYRVLAVDLYHGESTTEDAVAAGLSARMQTSVAMQDVAGAVAWLQGQGSRAVGVTGFCLGGAMTLAAACTVPGLACAVPFYGTPRDEWLRFGPRTPPVLGHFASHDVYVDPARVGRIAEAARQAGAPLTVEFYDAGHAFLRHGDPGAFVPDAAALAWERTRAFLAQHLGQPPR